MLLDVSFPVGKIPLLLTNQYIIMTIHNNLTKKFVAPLLLVLLFATSPAIADELKDIATMADQGQQEQALKRIDAYLDANPKDAQGLFTKGIILAESGKRDEAIATFNDLTKTYPNLPEPYNNLAVLYADAGKYDLAKKSLETAIKTHPSYATAHENLGDIYARMASEAYDKALKLDNKNSRAQSKLSLIKDLFSNDGKTRVAANNATPTRPIRKAEAATPTAAPTPKAIPPLKKPAEAVVDNTANVESSVNAAVDAWAAAWSSQSVDGYLASYADDFSPARGQSLSAWKNLRRSRVSGPSKINLELSNRKVIVIDDNNAKASFKQYYKADGGPIHTFKTLVLKKTNGNWLITEEIASN
jgi:tetratricopeptide (TPR) repeat protein